ncbi:hypothetical protein P12x_001777 [Tundrisphaera lichenicola]|uniref:hypothetical protein n=1 Tax=Tundrisphaera lichenicola TaxID=2029860 RepID=UPI003EBD0331
MSRTGWNRRVAGWPARLALPLVAAISAGLGSPSIAQDPPIEVANPPIAATPEVEAAPPAPVLPDDVQVIRFQGAEGMSIEVLGPPGEPVPIGDGKGLATVGMKVGVSYHLRLSGIPDRPGVELFPVVEVLGHLHRPPGIDPSKYPIRIVFREDDIEDAVGRGQLVTQVVYLEDPDQAIPLKLPKDEPPFVTLNPAEDPFKVARALGRVMAIVRIGGRQPTPEELAGPQGIGMPISPCPFTGSDGGACKLPCGPVCGTPPPPGRPWMPRDEFLCDGGDRDEPIHFAGNGGLAGIDPRDTVVNFNAGDRPRVLPTNVVCVYAPRFASVRVAVGVSESLNSAQAYKAEWLQRQELSATRQGTKKLAQSQVAGMNRLRVKATGLSTRVFAGEHSEVRVLGGFDSRLNIAMHQGVQGADRKSAVQTPNGLKQRVKIDGIKSAEGLVVTGVVQGANESVMSWPPLDITGVEEPPGKPGLAVVKRVNAEEAEPGDTLTYTINYRNMGNIPIRAVSITDSLLPRLEYVPGSAQGPAGTVFTFGENRAGALELRYDLPGAIAPGSEGSVTFQAIVR